METKGQTSEVLFRKIQCRVSLIMEMWKKEGGNYCEWLNRKFLVLGDHENLS